MDVIETIVHDAEFDVLMKGDERYPLIGNQSSIEMYVVNNMMPVCKGLPLYAGCLEKAIIAQKYIGGEIILGSMKVISADGTTTYGFDFNPPNELHAWVKVQGCVLDLSLPGVIMRGLKSRDAIGPFLEGRTPSILFGIPPEWLIYSECMSYRIK